MITRRMRRELVDNLGYLSSEVDEMEPSVAAVVIERGLARPSSGMPSSWKVPARGPRRKNKFFRAIGGSIRLVSTVVKNSIVAFRMASSKAVSLTVAIVVVPFVVNVLTSEEGITRESVKAATSDTKDMLLEGVGEIKKQKKRAKQFNAFTSNLALGASSGSKRPRTGETKSSNSGSGKKTTPALGEKKRSQGGGVMKAMRGSGSPKAASASTKLKVSRPVPTPLADAKKSRFSKITAVRGAGGKPDDMVVSGSADKGGSAEKLDFESFESVMDASTAPGNNLSVRLGILKNSLFPSGK